MNSIQDIEFRNLEVFMFFLIYKLFNLKNFQETWNIFNPFISLLSTNYTISLLYFSPSIKYNLGKSICLFHTYLYIMKIVTLHYHILKLKFSFSNRLIQVLDQTLKLLYFNY